MMDAAWRIACRIGFPLARQWWRLRRPRHAGALVALWHDGRVLAVRLTYRRELNFPGGGVRRGEDPVDAACRELHEEVGLTATPAALRLAWEQVAMWDFRRDHVRIYELELPAAPVPRPDRREVSEAMFLHPDALLAAPLPVFVRDYLRAAGGGPMTSARPT